MRVCVLGAGSWGTALAITLARGGGPVTLWGRDSAGLDRLESERVNARYLPARRFPDALQVEGSLANALDGADLALIAVPSHAFDQTVSMLSALDPMPGVAWATKGFDPRTGGLLHETALERLGAGPDLAVISGPTFALEVAAGLPTALTVASERPAFAAAVAARVHGERLRAYTSDDVIGVEVGGAVKNVLAIAAGIADGLGFGANTRAALVTRGLAELTRLGESLGGRRDTLMGLAGLGDLVLTCTDDQSRNRRFGLALAEGLAPAAAEASVGQVVEGIQSTRQTLAAARRHGVDMPITEQVARVVDGEASPGEAVEALLGRRPASEQPGA